MRPYRASLIILILFSCVLLTKKVVPVDAQAGIPWSDTCASEKSTCTASAQATQQNCFNNCKGSQSCIKSCSNTFSGATAQCGSQYNSCLQGRAATCSTYCGQACGSLSYTRYTETNATGQSSGPDCQCGCMANSCGGAPINCNYRTAVCQYDGSSNQFGYTCPECYGPPPNCPGGPGGLATCKNNASGLASWTCPTGGCNNPSPVCNTGVPTCTSGNWVCPNNTSPTAPSTPPGNGCTDVCNPACTNYNPTNCPAGDCAGQPLPSCPSNGPSDCVNGSWVCAASICSEDPPTCDHYDCEYGSWQCYGSPIVIDVRGEGFHMTDLQHGVLFDFVGNGSMVKIAWTDPNFGNAWLALDRNGNGTIDDATELFGDLTPQPASNHPNGYLALAEYDKPESGGNGDGFIDRSDRVYSQLRLWIDSNHNGVSERSELYTLDQLHVLRIALQYHGSRQRDQYGNLFRYKSMIWDEYGERPDRVTYDVFLLQQTPK